MLGLFKFIYEKIIVYFPKDKVELFSEQKYFKLYIMALNNSMKTTFSKLMI